MSSSYQAQAPAQSSQRTTRMRTILACKNCRQRKGRCITSEQPPTNPCQRCKAKNLVCEYVTVGEGDTGTHYPTQPAPIPSGMPPSTSYGSAYTSGYGNYGAAAPTPPLPYTAPPPLNARPRYAGAAYPPLALTGQQEAGAQHQRAHTPATFEYSPFAPAPANPSAYQQPGAYHAQGYQYYGNAQPPPGGSGGQYPPTNYNP